MKRVLFVLALMGTAVTVSTGTFFALEASPRLTADAEDGFFPLGEENTGDSIFVGYSGSFGIDPMVTGDGRASGWQGPAAALERGTQPMPPKLTRNSSAPLRAIAEVSAASPGAPLQGEVELAFAALSALPYAPRRWDRQLVAELACTPLGAIEDRDGDFARNAAALDRLCVTEERFSEGGVDWVIHTITRADNRTGPLWAVPHDDEAAAFDTGVYGLFTYGGTMVSVETGGERLNGRTVDPNRHFTGPGCDKSSPRFTAAFTRHLSRGAPVIALHSNDAGPLADGKPGGLSVKSPFSNSTVFLGDGTVGASPDDTMVILASAAPAGSDDRVQQRAQTLNGAGIHVLHEEVSAETSDCSLSNHLTLSGFADYFNIEVVHGDSRTQARMLDQVVSMVRSER